MLFDDWTDEQRAKARACSTAEELIDFAKGEGYELSDDELERVAGGDIWGHDHDDS